MANDGITFRDARTGQDITSRLLEFAFAAFLLLVFIGLSPFAVRDPNVLATGETIAAGEGDLIRQICYLLVFFTITAIAIQREGLRVLDAMPVLLVVLLAWCALSALWSAEPAITIRRVGLEVVVVMSVMLGVNTLGIERCLRILRIVLAIVLVVNWISIPILPQAVHLPNETDPGIVGDWRGLYFHKNITGAVCAISAMLFLYYAIRDRSRTDIAFLVGTLGFLVMTRSKSSMGLLPLSVGAGAIYFWAWRRAIDRAIVSVTLLLLAALAVALVILNYNAILHILSDPQEFTGRTAIWQAEIAFIRDHLWLGSGFGSFADTGALSPLHNYVSETWVQIISHGHNGYLQLMVTVGLVGFTLAMLAVILSPAVSFWRIDGMDLLLKAFLFSLFVFFLFHNLTESDFLESDGASWVVFLMMLAALRDYRLRQGS
ncbi:MAG TPA: O-antigen ligase family protein [Rhizomicrobium sp.]|nr:O-antigen ligase family protein [Rhizomicrobium sp.]